jgi:hypothetical protein
METASSDICVNVNDYAMMLRCLQKLDDIRKICEMHSDLFLSNGLQGAVLLSIASIVEANLPDI